ARMDHDFAAHQLVAEAPTLWRLDGVAAGVWVPMHEVGMQDAHMGLMYLDDQAMWRKADIGRNPVRAARMEDALENRSRRVRGGQGGEAGPKQQGCEPCFPLGAGCLGNRGQGVHRCISKKYGGRLEHSGVASVEMQAARRPRALACWNAVARLVAAGPAPDLNQGTMTVSNNAESVQAAV